MTTSLAVDYFAVFGLPPVFAQDPAELERRYLDLQRSAHPDRYAHLNATERRAAVEAAARINEAYRHLKDPLTRSTHLLALRGVEVLSAGSVPLPADLLLQQMDWHEALDDARRTGDGLRLNALCEGFLAERARLEAGLLEALDERGNTAAAADLVRQLHFLRRLIEQAQLAADGEMP